MKLGSNISNVILDFDGVILDSNSIKTSVFRQILNDESPTLVEKFIDYHKLNGGVSRFEKIRYFYDILKNDNSKNIIDHKIELFGEIVKEELIKAEFIPGILDFLNYCKNNEISCTICSGGKENELIEVARKRNIIQYFENIYGSPKTKMDIMRILDQSNRTGDTSVYFGDAFADYSAAKKYGLGFIFVSIASDWKEGAKLCNGNNSQVITDFTCLDLIGNT